MNVAFHPPSATHAEVSAWYDTHGLPRPKFDPQTLAPPHRREARAWQDLVEGSVDGGVGGGMGDRSVATAETIAFAGTRWTVIATRRRVDGGERGK